MIFRTPEPALWVLIAAVLACGGCAHTMLIAPDTDRLPRAATPDHPGINAAYYIAPADRARTVTTPGGGGDRAAYALYRDLEAPLYRVLSNHFDRVFALSSLEDHSFLHDKNVRFVFTPRFETQSSSDSAMTWPPTDFTLTIDVAAVDNAEAPVWSTHVSGTGHATFSEFKSDFGLAAKRAAEQAFQHLDDKLGKFPNR